jgi:lysozyme
LGDIYLHSLDDWAQTVSYLEGCAQPERWRVMNATLRARLIQVGLALGLAAGAGVAIQSGGEQEPSQAVQIAMVIGSHYESSGKHIGTPYIDKIGKGQPLTVCNGVTGKDVIAGKYYTEEDCKRLELPIYISAEASASRSLRYWRTYNPWVQASFIDMVYNLGPGSLQGTTIARLANAGDLLAACEQMPRWVRGTVNGKSVIQPGLVDRRGSTRELCADWGRDGHFSASLLGVK